MDASNHVAGGSQLKRKMTSSLALPQLKLPSAFGKTKFWKKRTVTISDLDPQFRVTYLGNVLTGWAKGDGCLDKPLATLWRNHLSSDKPQIIMKVTIAASGLKALTKEHGLTEYWAHRITYCSADPNYPKVFCWIYRHEGRKMKQELRCHAVLCPSENKANLMAQKLQERLHQALIDFKKEKISRQNARLSLANTIYENPTMPNRKIMLHTGSSNYRPPHDRGKSAPKLKVIEEAIMEEEEYLEESEEDNNVEVAIATTKVGVSPYAMALCRSRSAPLSNSDTAFSLDKITDCEIEDITAETSLASSLAGPDVGQLLDIDDIDLSFKPMNNEDTNLNSFKAIGTINHRLVASFDEDFDHIDPEDEEDEEDVITSYLPSVPISDDKKLHLEEIEVDSAASVSPDSQNFSTRSSERRKNPVNPSEQILFIQPKEGEELLGDDAELLGEAIGKMRLSEQDAISDESGYSEDSSHPPNPSSCNQNRKNDLHSGKTTVVTLNTSFDDRQTDCDNVNSHLHNAIMDDSSRQETSCDLTVHSAVISDFSQTKYLDKTNRVSQESNDFLQNRVTEFCINI